MTLVPWGLKQRHNTKQQWDTSCELLTACPTFLHSPHYTPARCILHVKLGYLNTSEFWKLFDPLVSFLCSAQSSMIIAAAAAAAAAALHGNCAMLRWVAWQRNIGYSILVFKWVYVQSCYQNWWEHCSRMNGTNFLKLPSNKA